MQLGPPEVLDFVVAQHAVAQVDVVDHLECMVSGSLVSVAGPPGCSLLQLVGCLVVGLLQAEAVLPHPVNCPCCSVSWMSQQVVHQQSGLLTEEQEVECEAGQGVRRVVVHLDQLRQMDGQPGLLLWRQRTQQTMHGAVETLALGVSLRVIRRRSGLLYVVGVAQLFHQMGLEVSSLVAVDPFRNTLPLKPFMDQDFGDRGCFLVPGGYGLRELGENVRHDKDVFSAVAGLV